MCIHLLPNALEIAISPATLQAYGAALEQRLAGWRGTFARRGQAYRVTASDAAFESLAGELVG